MERSVSLLLRSIGPRGPFAVCSFVSRTPMVFILARNGAGAIDPRYVLANEPFDSLDSATASGADQVSPLDARRMRKRQSKYSRL